jgi:hypothetical protein
VFGATHDHAGIRERRQWHGSVHAPHGSECRAHRGVEREVRDPWRGIDRAQVDAGRRPGRRFAAHGRPAIVFHFVAAVGPRGPRLAWPQQAACEQRAQGRAHALARQRTPPRLHQRHAGTARAVLRIERFEHRAEAGIFLDQAIDHPDFDRAGRQFASLRQTMQRHV